MAKAVRIQCINTQDRDDARERITHVGGVNHDGARWKLSQQWAIKLLERGWRCWVSVDGDRVWCVVATTRDGHKFIKTEIDGDSPENLLRLPECP